MSERHARGPARRALVLAGVLAGLLAGWPAQSTNVAALPLKTAVLAKPNVIFALDDSGSMDGELMLNSNDGAFWWDATAGSGWNGTGKVWFNADGVASAQWRKLIYLFPNGTGTGNRVYADADNDHFAAPPTAQLAFLRSSDFNPLYFDPTETYKPWVPAQLSSGAATYENASLTAARSHPVYGTGTFNVSATNSASTDTDRTFTGLPGMRLPGTARVCETTCTGTWPQVSTLGWTTSGGEHVVPAGKKFRVSMDYFPATYYLRKTCTVNGSSCVAAPDGSTLKRQEIRPENYATRAAYDLEIQNFANWWQYYRKRKLMLNASVGQVVESLGGLRVGMVRFNERPATSTRVTMYDLDSTSADSNGRRLLGQFYETNGNGSTPTRQTLLRIGEEYRQTGGPVQYACQRNSAFVVTDGFANAASVTVPSYTRSTWGSGAPYATTYAESLADIALAFYTLNLRTDLASGRVPATATNLNTNLHMTTYGLTMGARGLLYTAQGASPPTGDTWTAPTVNRHPSAVDDLWHATLNGRGQMYIADSPAQTAAQVRAGLLDILSQVGAQSGLAVSTVNLARGDGRVYAGTYNPSGWTGDLTASAINASTGAIAATASWSASSLLNSRDWTTRVIATYNGSAGVPFTASAVGSIVNPRDTWGTNTAVVNWLRGDRSGEGTTFRKRSGLLGAVINAEPLPSRDDKLVYLASGEGMLHAFDADTGREHWAFVPGAVLPNLGEISSRSYAFGTRLDATPTIGRVGTSGKRMLVGALGGGRRSYYALDVSSPRDMTESQLAAAAMWQFPAADDNANQNRMGFSYGRPVIARTTSSGDVVLVTSGYDDGLALGDGKGRLWMLAASSGAVLREFTTTEGNGASEAGLSHVSAYRETDGTVRYAYGGDLLGNVWRFDLDTGSTTLLAQLRDSAGNAQPVTTAPELVTLAGKRVVLVGTGRLLDITDFGSSRVQSFYAIADGAALGNARNALVARTYTRGASPEFSGAAVDWTTGRGWYVDLPAGEQINTAPVVAFGTVGFTTNVTGSSDCSQSSYMYVLDLGTGLKSADVGFASTLISATANSARLTTLRLSSGELVGTTRTSDNSVASRSMTSAVKINPTKNVWREIRR